MATIEGVRLSPATAARTGLLEERKSRPVVVWAVWGGVQLVVALYAWTMWLTHLPDPTPVGVSKVPTAMMWNIIFWQAFLTLGSIAMVYWFVVRAWRRAGHLTFDGMLVLAASLLYWQDYGAVWSTVTSTYNSGMLNWGSWYNYIPGWVPPDGRHFAEAPGFVAGIGTWGIVGFAMIANYAMRKAKARWPGMSRLQLVGVALAVGMYLDLVMEMLWLYGGLYHYSGVPGPKIFAGHYYAFPLVENLLWGSACAAFASFRYFRNDKGETIAERGIEDVRVSRNAKQGVRILAMFGALSTIFLAYNLTFGVVAGLHAQPWPEDTLKRSYFTQTQCGDGTERACAGKFLFRRGGLSITPEGTIGNPSGDAKLPKDVPHTKCANSPYDAPLSGDC